MILPTLICLSWAVFVLDGLIHPSGQKWIPARSLVFIGLASVSLWWLLGKVMGWVG